MRKFILLIALMATTMTAMADKPFELNLWQGKPKVKSSDKQDTAKVYVYLPEKKLATRKAIIICPGGAYSHLALDHEGKEMAEWLNQIGVAGIVLKYRMPNGDYEVPISDAEEAIRLVRSNAAKWNIDPNDVGIMGFSAGGHLASAIATHAKNGAEPNFQVLFYPVITMMPDITHKDSHDNFLGNNAKQRYEKEYSSDLQVSRMTPRAWIALSDDDTVVLPANGVSYYQACYKHDVPASLHVYPSGGHGWGMRSSFRFHIEMLLELKAWLQSF